MANGISGVGAVAQEAIATARQKSVGGKDGPDFGSALTDALKEASASEETATDTAVRFSEGDPDVGIHEVVLSAERANISLRYAVTMKNKLIEAYRDLMSTQV